MAIFTGAGVAIVTPMKENGDVNFEKLGRTDRGADYRRHRPMLSSFAGPRESLPP